MTSPSPAKHHPIDDDDRAAVHLELQGKGQPPGQAANDSTSEGQIADAPTIDKPDTPDEAARKKRRPAVRIVGIVAIAALVLGGIYYWLSGANKESTDDAYTDGRAISIAPQISGRVVSLDVTDNQFVKAGEPLIHIDPGQFIHDRDEARGVLETAKAQLAGQKYGAEIARQNFPAILLSAQADLAAAQASLEQRRADFERQKGLPKQATTQQDYDLAKSAFAQAQAQVLQAQARVTQATPVQQNIDQAIAQVDQLSGQVHQAQARLDQAELNLSYTVIKADHDGWITKRNIEAGNYVTAGQQILSIVSPEVWITANFKESQLRSMRPGQSVRIRIDAYPDLDLRGHVDSVQLGSGSKFTAFPAENATGNYVKIVQRVPVKIDIDSGLDPKIPLPLGISAEPVVTLK
jgi:membrane fusion protein (multidrug efflux system)